MLLIVLSLIFLGFSWVMFNLNAKLIKNFYQTKKIMTFPHQNWQYR